MFKKVLGLAAAFLMLFSLAACNTDFDLSKYKINAKAELANYVTESNYCPDKWSIICGIVDAGKQAVDAGENKADVDTAVEKTKKAIDMEIFEIEVDNLIDCSSFYYNEIASFPWRPIIMLWDADEAAVFDCTVDKGTFVLLGNPTHYVKTATIKSDGELYWQPHNRDFDGNIIDGNNSEQAFIEIVLRVEGNIVGYAVVEIYPIGEPGVFFKARIFKAAFIPKVGNEYQKITQEQIKAVIEQAKKE